VGESESAQASGGPPANMSGLVIVLAGGCGRRWQALERLASRGAAVPIVRCPGPPEEAVALCRRLRPCVLLLDVESFRRLLTPAETPRTSKLLGVRILVQAEQSDQDTIEGLVHAGCWGVVSAKARPTTIWKAATAVAAGQYWVPRFLLTQLVRRYITAEAFGLTAREAEILRLVARGSRNLDIAQKLFISVDTVRWHLRRIYSKLGVHDRLSAAMQASGLLGALGDVQQDSQQAVWASEGRIGSGWLSPAGVATRSRG